MPVSASRYVYTCRKIEPEGRDVARKHGKDARELNPAAEVGDLAQVAVTLDAAGVEAYMGASNLIPGTLEHDEWAIPAGWLEPTDEVFPDSSGVNVPADEDLRYLKALWSRSAKNGQGAGVKIAVLDQGLGAPVARLLRDLGVLKGSKAFVPGRAERQTVDHGSHVACSATPDRAELYHGMVLGASGGPVSAAIEGIHWAASMGAVGVNMSLSSSGGEASFEQAIREVRKRGTVVLCAGGNEALRGNPRRFPGGCASAVAVSAFDRTTDRKAPFSSFHDYIDLAASGVNTLSLLADGSLGRMSGSSMAAPEALYCLAVLVGLGATPEGALQAMKAGARDTAAPATHEGSGVLNLRAANKKLAA